MRYLTLSSIVMISSALIPFSATSQSTTEHSKDIRGEYFCFPVKKVPKLVRKIGEVKETRRNIVDVSLMPRFLIKDGGGWPEQFFLRTKTKDIEIPIKKPSGETPGFIEVAQAYPRSEVCIQDKSRAERPKHDEGLYFEMGLAPLFHNRSGRHDLAELIEGTKDGKTFYKK